MLRVAAAVCLVIVTAAGPVGCCCTFSRLAHRFGDKPTAPAPQSAAACCCHGSGEPAPADAPEHPSSPERHDSHDCPCKHGGCEVVGLPAAQDEARETSARAFGESFSSPAILAAGLAPLTFAAPVFRESPPLGPSVSTDVLLYVFHILRC